MGKACHSHGSTVIVKKLKKYYCGFNDWIKTPENNLEWTCYGVYEQKEKKTCILAQQWPLRCDIRKKPVQQFKAAKKFKSEIKCNAEVSDDRASWAFRGPENW